jgi:hypothetical protein
MSTLPNLHPRAKFNRRPAPYHYRAAIRDARQQEGGFLRLVLTLASLSALLALVLASLPIW